MHCCISELLNTFANLHPKWVSVIVDINCRHTLSPLNTKKFSIGNIKTWLYKYYLYLTTNNIYNYYKTNSFTLILKEPVLNWMMSLLNSDFIIIIYIYKHIWLQDKLFDIWVQFWAVLINLMTHLHRNVTYWHLIIVTSYHGQC